MPGEDGFEPGSPTPAVFVAGTKPITSNGTPPSRPIRPRQRISAPQSIRVEQDQFKVALSVMPSNASCKH
jgi:hypothetical protein